MKERTEKNLWAAFAGESQAHMKYMNFADKARHEGFVNVARLFQANSYAEQVHASNHLKALNGVKGTPVNLNAALEGEEYEVTEMYPEFIKAAEEDKEPAAVFSTKAALAAEEVHAGLYKRAKEAVDTGKDLVLRAVQVCTVCGFTVEGDAPDKCPVCGAPKDKFRQF